MKDPYLLAKALAYAIVAIETRPEMIREQADYHDMVLLFRKLPANEREMFLDEARRDLVNHSESVSVESLPGRDESPSNDALRHAREIVLREQ
ncbi:MAG: hypothetical protein WAK34_12380 [Rhodoplanes sp.]